MLVYDFVAVGAPFEHASERMHAARPGALAEAAAVAFDCPTVDGRLEHGPMRVRQDAIVVDVRLAGDPHRTGFEYFEGEFQLSPLRASRSHLSLSASYEPAGNASFTSLERTRAHRDTELRVRDLLAIVALQLEQAAGGW
ncbi:MAG TPA: hypothetical protein VEP49_13780 [Acidimicrobiia bacterium]|nr:hypothetical protein [Acidimicrobiia bacterium]